MASPDTFGKDALAVLGRMAKLACSLELSGGTEVWFENQMGVADLSKGFREGVTPVYLPEGHVSPGKSCIVQSFTAALVSKGKLELVFSVSDFSVVLLNVNEVDGLE